MPDALETVAAAEAEGINNWEPDDDEGAIPGERERLLDAVDRTLRALDEVEIDYVFVGGVAAALLGRPRVTHDVDILVRPEDARPLLVALGNQGFETEERFPHWLYKAHGPDQLIDIIFRSAGDIYLDEEMVRRAERRSFHGREVQLMAPEDMVVMKALAHEEHTPRHWHDALAVLGESVIDWDYLVRRAHKGPRRVLSLLLYAQSNDLPVPDLAVRKLFATVMGDGLGVMR
jgi:predicted nucleotidyltransferase